MKWCDLSCEYASFPKAQAVDGAGSCRTFAALYCARLERLVHKNGPCPCEGDTDLDDGRSDPASRELAD
ncbi:MAG: hypothetical protein NTY36_05050 [Deltaproteobacteria bacterium]|nr:hypothetical protein [Deltaproteobacteria bacterium]